MPNIKTSGSDAWIEHLVTAGNLDPAGPPVHDNNVWLVGDNEQVLVIDPAHDAAAVAVAVGWRKVVAIVLTHGHWDHIRAARNFARLVGDAPIYLSEADRFLWEQEHGDAEFLPLTDNQEFEVADLTLTALATPGHTPGSTSISAPAMGVVFTGDTLFSGGPGATRWDYSSFEGILTSISERLFPLGDETLVHTGHGPSTDIGTERRDFDAWRARGW